MRVEGVVPADGTSFARPPAYASICARPFLVPTPSTTVRCAVRHTGTPLTLQLAKSHGVILGEANDVVQAITVATGALSDSPVTQAVFWQNTGGSTTLPSQYGPESAAEAGRTQLAVDAAAVVQVSHGGNRVSAAAAPAVVHVADPTNDPAGRSIRLSLGVDGSPAVHLTFDLPSGYYAGQGRNQTAN